MFRCTISLGISPALLVSQLPDHRIPELLPCPPYWHLTSCFSNFERSPQATSCVHRMWQEERVTPCCQLELTTSPPHTNTLLHRFHYSRGSFRQLWVPTHTHTLHCTLATLRDIGSIPLRHLLFYTWRIKTRNEGKWTNRFAQRKKASKFQPLGRWNQYGACRSHRGVNTLCYSSFILPVILLRRP